MIRLSNVSKEYRNGARFSALKNVSLDVAQGEFVSILGPSGSGKSTLLHIMGGLDRPTAGTVEVAGEDLGTMGEGKLARFRNRTVGFVFQFFHLLPQLSAFENVMLPLVYAGMEPRMRALRAKELLTAMGLETKLRQPPNKLSGGEQQRVAIARALANDPPVIFADEPTGNLDSETGRYIVELLAWLNGAGKTLVVVTHDEGFAKQAHRMITLKDGSIISP